MRFIIARGATPVRWFDWAVRAEGPIDGSGFQPSDRNRTPNLGRCPRLFWDAPLALLRQAQRDSWALRKSTLLRVVASWSIMLSTALQAWMTVP